MQALKVVIIDYGSGNLQSVLNALDKIKTPSTIVQITSDPRNLKSATHIILPGVGAFGDCISSLNAIEGMNKELKTQVLENKKPFLGICVGMQLLADLGLEHGKNAGLGFIAGDVIEIDNQNETLKVPHMGWNNINIHKSHPILDGINDDEHFYFVHSFHFVVENKENIVATVNYGQKITAIIAKENIVATQFHPEKSSAAGLKILQNFIR
ncbi:MAG: glutamine amidotransferase [Rickettsiales bacterium]|jgi:glutamine amidotransferase